MTGAHEIGGYLELERFRGPMLHEGEIALNCGRACLEYLIELREIEAVWLPNWLCDSVSAVCAKHDVEVRMYEVGWDMRPVYDFAVAEKEYLYLVDYYGQLDPKDIDRATAFSGGRLAVDESQSYFRNPWEGVDTLWTCRKWFGVADGAFLHTGDGARLDRELPRSESFSRMGFVLGRFERPAADFLAESRANNARFSAEPMGAMSSLTENLLRAVDYTSVADIRRFNWDFLDSALGPLNLLDDLSRPDAPFMYPCLVEDASDARARLAEEGVFVPTLWPNVLGGCDSCSWAYRYARDILPLPVDQRYGVGEMEVVAREVKRCLL